VVPAYGEGGQKGECEDQVILAACVLWILVHEVGLVHEEGDDGVGDISEEFLSSMPKHEVCPISSLVCYVIES
jgi:hypothetical protein